MGLAAMTKWPLEATGVTTMRGTEGRAVPGAPQATTPSARRPVESVFARFHPDHRRDLERILCEPITYIHHEIFANAGTAKRLFGKQAADMASLQPWCNSADARRPDDASALPIATLVAKEEQKLFLRMNYARYRMAKLLDRYAGKRLSSRAANELLWWCEQSIVARCQIVQANVPLVLAMARRTRLGSIDFAELISEGNMALLRSVDKFDCGRGFKFSTYACRAILKSFSRVAMRSSRYRGRFPTEFDPTLEKSHYIEDQRELHEAECVDELRGIIRSNTAELNDVEVRVLQARFALAPIEGMESGGPKTLEQVGLLIGVTKERVRQIQNKALAKLRSKLQEDFLAA
jgi:RNA polymerase sigma factor (sigma-70 family)